MPNTLSTCLFEVKQKLCSPVLAALVTQIRQPERVCTNPLANESQALVVVVEVRLDLLKLLVGLETLINLAVVQFDLFVCFLSLLN